MLRKSILALALGIASYNAAANEPFTLEDIPKIKSVVQTSVSPSGDLIAFTRTMPRELYQDKDGRSYIELFITDAKGNETPYITGKNSLSNIQWGHDNQHVYFTAKLGDDKFTKLYRIPVNGGERQLVLSLKETSISGYKLDPTGKQVAILAKPAKDKSEKKLKELGFKAEVYEADLTNMQLHVTELAVNTKPQTLDPMDINGYVSDMNWGPKGANLLVKTQPTALIDDKYMKSQWHMYNLAKQQVTISFATEGKLGDAELSYKGDYVAMVGAEDKHDPSAGRLFIANTETGEVRDALPGLKAHVGDIEWANNSNYLYFVKNKGTSSSIASIKATSSKSKTLLKSGKLLVSQLTLSDSDKTVGFKGNSRKHTNEAFVLRKGKEKRLTDSNPWFADKRFAKQETIKLKARDGVELDAVLVYPLDYEKGKTYPLIMGVHGGPESHDKDGWTTNYSRPAQVAAARGYAFVFPNYRGSTGKGVDYSKLGQNDYAGKEFNDLVDIKDHLVEMGLVDSKRVGITGGSYGGYASAWGATKLTEHFAASVMFVGISNQLSKFGTTDISNEMHLVHARSYPWDKWQYYLERSPIYWAGQSKTPLLIMHGKDDPRVHPAQSMEMYRYMKVQGKDVRLVYYPGEGHGNRKAAAQYDYSLRLMRWMDNYLIEGNKEMPTHELNHKEKLEAAKDK